MTIPKLFFVFSFLLFAFAGSSAYGSNAKHYIVYLGDHSLLKAEDVINSNHELLAQVIGGVEKAQRSTIHHYHKSFRGFSAMLTPEQADTLTKKRSIVSVFESKRYHLQTTRSWDFMVEQVKNGSSKGLFSEHRSQIKGPKHDVIVGHFDSGVWPESNSFSENGLGPVPDYFRGQCIPGDQFPSNKCNRKIIGARYYYEGYEISYGPLERAGRRFYRSARDDFSHGSHTASIAAGLPNAIQENLVIQGGAPGARLSVYKVCWFDHCDSADILKAYDDAIHDNVDVITYSIGLPSPASYFEDAMAIGAYHAFKNGIVVVASAGNDRRIGSVVNVAPWMITVAASTIDRQFINYITLGTGYTIQGYGLNNDVPRSSFPLTIYTRNYPQERYCKTTLNSAYTYNKIVVCYMEAGEDSIAAKSEIVREAGGAGMIVIDEGDATQVIFDAYAVPISVIELQQGMQLEEYITTSSNPFAIISPTEAVLNTKPAPTMAYFSRQGPNAITPDVIKPDITAPGFNIFAAFPGGPNEFGIDSGTSMSAPHVTGVASTIRATNKRWSVAAIKSAIMTTAIMNDNTGGPIQSGAGPATPFDFGSGHLEPDLALSPGLVYEFDEKDLIDFLCYHITNDYDFYKLSNMVGRNVVCNSPPVPPYQLNYPSIAISSLDRSVSVRRTVTFVASRNGPKVYGASIEPPEGVDVTVEPQVLDFSHGEENLSYTVHFTPLRVAPGYAYTFGSITWSDENQHRVRSPIAVRYPYNSFIFRFEKARNAAVHHYHKSFRGFSAMLTPEQADKLSKNQSVVSVFESTSHPLHTTRSWNFMLEQVKQGGYGRGLFTKFQQQIQGPYHDVIVGHFDSGVWPESSSFNDHGLGPVPDYFKGQCTAGDNFPSNTCNRKIIGARYYYQGFELENGLLKNQGSPFYRSARDDNNHGTHTASIAVGAPVQSTILNSLKNQVIVGGASKARLSVYKACWFNKCSCADLLKAYDDAIWDNVDVISLSAGQNSPVNYFEDCIAIGAYHAFRSNIVVVASAGNDKPNGNGITAREGSVTNVAPWMITVGASTADRQFVNSIVLGNEKSFQAHGISGLTLDGSHPIVSGGYCHRNSLKNRATASKILVCFVERPSENRTDKSEVVRQAGGVGMILVDKVDLSQVVYANYVVPTVVIGPEEARHIEDYIKKTKTPFASISPVQEKLNTKPSPKMAYFSSKGPNSITPDIIKPDLIAPGLNILAAIPHDQIGMFSGTSMAAPHVTGVAAVLQATNKRWSVAAIKSALMTTAILNDNTGNPIQSGNRPATPFDIGSGHLEPDLAFSPGLVYEFNENDLIDFLCYHTKDHNKVNQMVGKNVQCKSQPVPPYQLNYPTIAISELAGPISVRRTVTILEGKKISQLYRVSIEQPEGVDVTVEPEFLDFSRAQGSKLNYTVHFTPRNDKVRNYVFGSITWSNGKQYQVKSAIAVRVVV
ncbi:hypothetical protein Dsin_006727 [Dipteronia sinensis]|uniref:Uncharacterized protein n=1 Tax=Dipteronia sinensis TaxID=43782 RepID=A0AAE0AZV2_9ROSI|nr:hypothetical protein Dsin_006727 [Dipteronia sinensis]